MMSSYLFVFLETTLTASKAILVDGKSHARTALRAALARTDNLAILVDLIVLQSRQLHLLSLVMGLLGLGIDLLLSLLGTTSQSQNEMKGGLLLNVVISKSSAIFKLLTSEDKALLIRRNSFLILNLSLDVVNGIRWFDLQGDGLSRKRLHEDLHCRQHYSSFS